MLDNFVNFHKYIGFNWGFVVA